jgi:hypothetical protein
VRGPARPAAPHVTPASRRRPRPRPRAPKRGWGGGGEPGGRGKGGAPNPAYALLSGGAASQGPSAERLSCFGPNLVPPPPDPEDPMRVTDQTRTLGLVVSAAGPACRSAWAAERRRTGRGRCRACTPGSAGDTGLCSSIPSATVRRYSPSCHLFLAIREWSMWDPIKFQLLDSIVPVTQAPLPHRRGARRSAAAPR